MGKVITWGLLLLFLAIVLWGLLSPEGFLVKVANLALSSGQSFLPNSPNPDLEGRDNTECTVAIGGTVHSMQKNEQFCVNTIIYTCNPGGDVDEEKCKDKGSGFDCREKNDEWFCVDTSGPSFEGLPAAP